MGVSIRRLKKHETGMKNRQNITLRIISVLKTGSPRLWKYRKPVPGKKKGGINGTNYYKTEKIQGTYGKDTTTL